jgi:hypothetical protein
MLEALVADYDFRRPHQPFAMRTPAERCCKPTQ